MYKLVVFAAVLACAAAAPGLIGAPIGYGGIGLASPLAAPISPWGHGLIGSPYVGAPVVKTVAPIATSYSNSVRIASPVLAAHAPVIAAPAYAAPAYAAHAYAPALTHAW